MTRKEILEFVSQNPVFSLATTDADKPRTRMMMLFRADENGIIFSTGRDKDVNHQLQKNPAVEMCFYNHRRGLQVRIEGTVEMVDDLQLRKQIVDEFTFLKPWVEQQGYDILVPYRLRNARATAWTMETNAQPKTYTQL